VETLFTADQHVEYDPIREMYLWVRQGEQVRIGGGLSNIDRLAVSRDLDRWVALDLISVDILNQAGIIEGSFDYPNSIKNMAVCDKINILKPGGVRQTLVVVLGVHGCRTIQLTFSGTQLRHTMAECPGYDISIQQPFMWTIIVCGMKGNII
jgi:hypothetical protein